ncbi:hypothetical protein [Synechococcus sp. CBW1004]|uniref:hypothetical protein n=1 Tax=Synechococcus sp. CBW1004 TaxID=1353136 RepID=UPI0018CC8F05|nr:hypothetical protein [Synechococcus sp. CBW1004]QPN63023.1 hypothetical protein H8F25_15565 [Synechococcus sp. CBW1004]
MRASRRAATEPGQTARPLDPLPHRPLAWIRQIVACGLLLLLSARIPAHLAAFAAALSHPARAPFDGPLFALAMVGLDGFGVLCAGYLSHARLRGVPLLRCYPPRRLIPLSLHFLGLLWGLLTLGMGSASGG